MPKQKRRVRAKKKKEIADDIDEQDVNESEEEMEYEEVEKEKSTNAFNIIIAILLFLLVAIGVIFLVRIFTLDQLNVHHSGIPSQNGDEGFEVIGTATVPAIPDIAVVNFSVENRSESIRDVQDENSTQANQVIEVLRREGVDQDDIQVVTYNINPQYQFDDNGNRELDGFEAVQRFEAKVRAINNTGEILNALIDNGATNISDLRFTLDDVERLEDEALIKAISDARVLAETSVAATGHGLGRVISITEVEEDEAVLPTEFSVSAETVASEDVIPEIYMGKQEIKKVVKVQFGLN